MGVLFCEVNGKLYSAWDEGERLAFFCCFCWIIAFILLGLLVFFFCEFWSDRGGLENSYKFNPRIAYLTFGLISELRPFPSSSLVVVGVWKPEPMSFLGVVVLDDSALDSSFSWGASSPFFWILYWSKLMRIEMSALGMVLSFLERSLVLVNRLEYTFEYLASSLEI